MDTEGTEATEGTKDAALVFIKQTEFHVCVPPCAFVPFVPSVSNARKEYIIYNGIQDMNTGEARA